MTRKRRQSSEPGDIYLQGGWRKRTYREDRLETVEEVGGGSGGNGVSEIKGIKKFTKEEVVTDVKRSRMVNNRVSESCPLNRILVIHL